MPDQIQQSYLNKARKDKFLLVFDIPPILKTIQSNYTRGDSTIIPDSVQFSVFGTMVPGVAVKGVATRYVGDTLYVSSHTKDPYPPVNVKFIVDSGYNNYWVVYQWLNLLHDQKTGQYNAKGLQGVNCSHNDYQTDISVYGLDEYDNKVIEFKYTKCFPTSLDEITFDAKTTGEMELESGFTFLFSQMHIKLLGCDRSYETLS
jgi:hypothetical protein